MSIDKRMDKEITKQSYYGTLHSSKSERVIVKDVSVGAQWGKRNYTVFEQWKLKLLSITGNWKKT